MPGLWPTLTTTLDGSSDQGITFFSSNQPHLLLQIGLEGGPIASTCETPLG